MKCFLLLSLVLLAGCGDDGSDPPPTPLPAVLELVAGGLESPLFIASPPGDTGRLFVVEQEGRIRVIQHGTLLTAPFLDIVDSVSQGGERGLLGLAFAPDYATTGAFYVFTTDLSGDVRILRFKVSADSNLADPGSGVEILAFAHPQENHNGGMLAFGNDGYLYVGSGDGGGGGDPNETGQDPSDLLGAILRIDASGDSAGYAIPASNPFVGDSGFAGEVWTYGLRNPWRFSFDRTAHDLWIGDVGQGEWEEVDFLSAGTSGQNLGWDVLEGTHCFEPSSGCSTAGMTMPVFDYSHAGGRCSVIGGYVYRGTAVPALTGWYLYGDLCDGEIHAYGTGAPDGSLATGSSLLTFGEDAAGEVYVGLGDGRVLRVGFAVPELDATPP